MTGEMPDNEIALEMLNLWSLCGRFNCLPKAGGIEDQDAIVIEYFSIIIRVLNEKKEHKDNVEKAKAAGMRLYGGKAYR